jgi:hypothetical protein
MKALFESLWFYKSGVKKGLCVLFQDINILLQAANNLKVTHGNQSFSMAWC